MTSTAQGFKILAGVETHLQASACGALNPVDWPSLFWPGPMPQAGILDMMHDRAGTMHLTVSTGTRRSPSADPVELKVSADQLALVELLVLRKGARLLMAPTMEVGFPTEHRDLFVQIHTDHRVRLARLLTNATGFDCVTFRNGDPFDCRPENLWRRPYDPAEPLSMPLKAQRGVGYSGPEALDLAGFLSDPRWPSGELPIPLPERQYQWLLRVAANVAQHRPISAPRPVERSPDLASVLATHAAGAAVN